MAYAPAQLRVGHEDMETRFPDWLYPALVEDALPWQDARVMTLAEFNGKYSLHDSDWIGLFQNVGFDGDVIMAFHWALIAWKPEKQVPSDDEYLFLFTRLTLVEDIRITGYELGRESGCWRGGMYTESIDADGVHILSVSDWYDGAVVVSYRGQMQILVLDKDGKEVEI
jgi:hypothetical protein